MKAIKKAQNGATRQLGTDSFGRPHPIVEHIDRKPKPKPKPKVVPKPKSQSQIDTEKRIAVENAKFKKERDAYKKLKEIQGEVHASRYYDPPSLATWGWLNKTKNTKKPDKLLEALSKDKNGGKVVKKAKSGTTVTKAKDGKWMQKAAASIKRRGTEGKCTPITKPGCTGKAKALAKTFKKIAKSNKKK